MRKTPGNMEAIWRSGDYTGNQRPMARVTVQRPRMALRHYSVMSTFRQVPPSPSGATGIGAIFGTIDPYHGTKVSQSYADFFFTPLYNPRELPNIKSVSWNRSLDQDFATLTLELYNTKPKPETTVIPLAGPGRRDLDYPGWYTYDRGKSRFASRWGHTTNEWRGLLMPDNVIRTYEGYGSNKARPPELDRNLIQTGVWIIDTVVVNALGFIVVNCRDVGRLLLDHQVNEPVIPGDFDPLDFAPWNQKVTGIPAKTRVKLRANDHSNAYGPVKGTDGQLHTVFDRWNYRGHRIEDALDDSPATYWMSYSHIKPRWPWGCEWVEFSASPTASMASFQMWTLGSGYTCYVSLFKDGHWLNKDGVPAGDNDPRISWSPNPTNPNRDQHARRPYVKSFTVGPEFRKRLTTVALPKTYAGVEKIRLSFVNLQHIPGVAPAERSYRVAIRSVRVFGPEESTEVSLRKGPAGSNPGRYGDYTDIVKLCCAWAGFFWPPNGLQRATDGTTWKPYYTHGDWDLGVNGRVWGDFEPTGTTGPTEYTADSMQNRSLMDVITMVRNVIGYLFLIDEIGSAQWRMPNIYKAGNWLNDEHMNPVRTTKVPIIDEKQVLLSLDSTINSGSIREIIRVTNFVKKAEVRGFVPNDVGLRRVLTWNEPNFKDEDVQRAAEMVGPRSLFTWRRDRLVIAAYPGFQLDDQIQIFERQTSEGFIHYISGIASSLNMETGEWTYTLETHWLGDRAQDVWAIYPEDIPASHLRNLTRRPIRPGFKRNTSGEGQ